MRWVRITVVLQCDSGHGAAALLVQLGNCLDLYIHNK